jgi:polyhydroxybutyrate depolymerase
MRYLLLMAMLWSLSLVMLGCGSTVREAALASLGCGSSLPHGLQKGEVQGGWTVNFHDSLEARTSRDYSMYVPTSYHPSSPMPMILDFHGFYSDDKYVAKHDGVSMAAEAEGFIVVYPDGTKDYRNGYWWNNWNGGGTNGTGAGKLGKDTCLPDHSEYPCYDSCAKAGLCESGYKRTDCACSGCSDDIGFIAALLAKMKSTFCIDESRIHGTGMSNGAMFLYYLATTPVGMQLASIVPTEGSFLIGNLDVPKVPMPVIDVHGTADNCVPSNTTNSWGKYKWDGCPIKGLKNDGCAVGDDTFVYHVTSDILAAWSSVNKCPSGAKSKHVATPFDGKTAWSCTMPHGDECEAPVWFCTHNLGHTWPFNEGKHQIRTKDYGDMLWYFMKDKRRNVSETTALDKHHQRDSMEQHMAETAEHLTLV